MYTKLTTIAAALSLLLVAGSASAAIDPHDLEVKGTIKTPSCVVTASGNGEYNYGTINHALIPATDHLQLSTLTQTWSVDCNGATTYLGFQVIDNQAGSESSDTVTRFGLGRVAGYPDSRIGNFRVGLSNASVDGTPRNILLANPGAANGTAQATYYLQKLRSHTWASGTTSAVPLAGSRFVVDMGVTGFLANANLRGAPITEGTPISGNLTINYSFGL